MLVQLLICAAGIAIGILLGYFLILSWAGCLRRLRTSGAAHMVLP